MGFAFLKPLGRHLESHAQRERGGEEEEEEGGGEAYCQRVFVLPNDLQKETLRSRGAVSVDVSELVFHIHYHFSTLEVLIACDLN